jgi:hypothetical protein
MRNSETPPPTGLWSPKLTNRRRFNRISTLARTFFIGQRLMPVVERNAPTVENQLPDFAFNHHKNVIYSLHLANGFFEGKRKSGFGFFRVMPELLWALGVCLKKGNWSAGVLLDVGCKKVRFLAMRRESGGAPPQSKTLRALDYFTLSTTNISMGILVGTSWRPS